MSLEQLAGIIESNMALRRSANGLHRLWHDDGGFVAKRISDVGQNRSDLFIAQPDE
jgi:hypothetical protein